MAFKRRSLVQLRFLTIAFWLFQKGVQQKDISEETVQEGDEELRFNRIRCPLCRWQPNSTSRWQCGDCGHPEYFYNSCGMVWNTFTTRGLCPGCRHQWLWTSCLRCGEWSLHEEWYTIEDKQFGGSTNSQK